MQVGMKKSSKEVGKKVCKKRSKEVGKCVYYESGKEPARKSVASM